MERLKESFQIRRDIAIARGDYSFRRYNLRASSDQTERISGGGNVQWGEFWDGTRKSFGGNLTLRINYRFNVRTDYSRNQVDLVNGNFTTDLIGMRFVYSLNPGPFSTRSFSTTRTGTRSIPISGSTLSTGP